MLGMQISVLPNIQCDLVDPGPQQPDMTSQISADSQSLISGPIWSRMHDGSGTKENMNKINTNLWKIFPCMHRAWERQTQLPTQRNDKIKFSLQQAMENFFKIRSSSLKIGCKKKQLYFDNFRGSVKKENCLVFDKLRRQTAVEKIPHLLRRAW